MLNSNETAATQHATGTIGYVSRPWFWKFTACDGNLLSVSCDAPDGTGTQWQLQRTKNPTTKQKCFTFTDMATQEAYTGETTKARGLWGLYTTSFVRSGDSQPALTVVYPFTHLKQVFISGVEWPIEYTGDRYFTCAGLTVHLSNGCPGVKGRLELEMRSPLSLPLAALLAAFGWMLCQDRGA